MHEYSIVQSLIERIEREVAAHKAARVVRVHVKLGELSGVDATLLATAYETFRDRTVCEAAPMVLDRVAPEWRCVRCDRALQNRLRCDACGGPGKLTSGDEIVLQRIEMEVPDV